MSDTARQPDLIVRASSLAEAFDCAARFKARIIEGKKMPSNPPAQIGTAIHAGTAVYDLARVEAREPSVEEAIEMARTTIMVPKEDVVWDDVRPSKAADTAGTLTLNYCLQVAHQYVFDAVEAPMLSFDIEAYNGIKIRFTGTIDRRRVKEVLNEDFTALVIRKGIADIKTGKAVVDPNGDIRVDKSAAQFGVYELLEMMATKSFNDHTPTLLPALVLGFSTAKHHRAAAVEVDHPRDLLFGDAKHRGLIDELAMMVKEDSFPGNPRSMMCTERTCPIFNSCWYRQKS